MKKFLIWLVATLICAGAHTESKESWLIKEEFLSPEVENFDCHSSCLVETTPGSFCAVWKGGPGAGKSNIDMTRNVGIWLSLFDGKEWSEPREIATSPNSVCWTPVLCKFSPEELFLFYRIGPDPRRVMGFLKRSCDGGQTWSEAELLPAGIAGPSKNKPVVTQEGWLVCPSSVEVGEPTDPFKATACWIEISPDKGHSWSKIGPIEIPGHKFGAIEPALFFDQRGQMRLVCRDRASKVGRKGYIWSAISEDGGFSWSQLTPTSLPNPDSGIEVVDNGEGKITLIYNHSHTNRYPLNLAFSSDGGEHWSEPVVLSAAGEFPSAVQASDGVLHVLFATGEGQRRIKHIVVNSRKLEELR